MVIDAPSFLIYGAAEKLCLRFEYLNTNVPLCEELVVMRNLMNQIANMGGEESLQQLWNSSLQGMNQYSQDSCTGVGYQIGSAGLSFIKNLLMLLGLLSASAWFDLLYNHWCNICLAKYESRVELGKRVPKMVGTGQIKLGKDGDFTWQTRI